MAASDSQARARLLQLGKQRLSKFRTQRPASAPRARPGAVFIGTTASEATDSPRPSTSVSFQSPEVAQGSPSPALHTPPTGPETQHKDYPYTPRTSFRKGAEGTKDLHERALALVPHGASQQAALVHVTLDAILAQHDACVATLGEEDSHISSEQLRTLAAQLLQYVAEQQVAMENMKQAELELAAGDASLHQDEAGTSADLQLQLDALKAQLADAKAAASEAAARQEAAATHQQQEMRAFMAEFGLVADGTGPLNQLRLYLNDLRTEAEAARHQGAERVTELTSERDALAAQVSSLESGKQAAEASEAALQEKVRSLQALAGEAGSAQEELAGAVQRLQSERDALAAQVSSLESGKQAAEASEAALQEKVRSLQDRVEMLEGQVRAVEAERTAFQQSLSAAARSESKELADASSQVGDDRIAVAQERLALSNEAAALRAREAALNQKAAELQALEAAGAERAAAVSTAEAQVQARRKELQRKEEAVNTAAQRIAASEEAAAQLLKEAKKALQQRPTQAAQASPASAPFSEADAQAQEALRTALSKARDDCSAWQRRCVAAEQSLEALQACSSADTSISTGPLLEGDTPTASATAALAAQELQVLRTSHHRLAAEAAGLRAEVSVLLGQVEEGNERERHLVGEVSTLRARVGAEAGRSAQALEAAEAAQGEAAVAMATQQELQLQVASLESRLARAEAAETSLGEQLAAAQSANESASATSASLSRELAAMQAGAVAERREVQDLQASLAAADEERLSLAREVGGLRAALEAARKRSNHLEERLRVVTAAASTYAAGGHSTSVAMTPTKTPQRARYDAGSGPGDGLPLFMSPSLAVAMTATPARDVLGADVSDETAAAVAASQREASLAVQLEAAGEREERVRSELRSLAGRLLHRRRETLALEARCKELVASEAQLRSALHEAERECRRCAGLAAEAGRQLKDSQGERARLQEEAADAVSAARSAAAEATARIAAAESLSARLEAALSTNRELQGALKDSQEAEAAASSRCTAAEVRLADVQDQLLQATREAAQAKAAAAAAAAPEASTSLSQSKEFVDTTQDRQVVPVPATAASHPGQSLVTLRLLAAAHAVADAADVPAASTHSGSQDTEAEALAALPRLQGVQSAITSLRLALQRAESAAEAAGRREAAATDQADKTARTVWHAVASLLPQPPAVREAPDTAAILSLVSTVRFSMVEAGKAAADAEGDAAAVRQAAEREGGAKSRLEAELQDAQRELQSQKQKVSQLQAALETQDTALAAAKGAVSDLQQQVAAAVVARDAESKARLQAAFRDADATTGADASSGLRSFMLSAEGHLERVTSRLGELQDALQAMAAVPPAVPSTAVPRPGRHTALVAAPAASADYVAEELAAYKELCAERTAALEGLKQQHAEVVASLEAVSHARPEAGASGDSAAAVQCARSSKAVLSSLAGLFSVWKDMLTSLNQVAPATGTGAWGDLLTTSNIITDTLTSVIGQAQQACKAANLRAVPRAPSGSAQLTTRSAAAITRLTDNVTSLTRSVEHKASLLAEAATAVHSAQVAAAAARRQAAAAEARAAAQAEAEAAALDMAHKTSRELRQSHASACRRMLAAAGDVQQELAQAREAFDALRSALRPGTQGGASAEHPSVKLAQAALARAKSLEEGRDAEIRAALAMSVPAGEARATAARAEKLASELTAREADVAALRRKVRLLEQAAAASAQDSKAAAEAAEDARCALVAEVETLRRAVRRREGGLEPGETGGPRTQQLSASALRERDGLGAGEGRKNVEAEDGLSSVATGHSESVAGHDAAAVPPSTPPRRPPHSPVWSPESSSTRAFSQAFGGAPPSAGTALQDRSPSPGSSSLRTFTSRLADLAARTSARTAPPPAPAPAPAAAAAAAAGSSLPSRRSTKQRGQKARSKHTPHKLRSASRRSRPPAAGSSAAGAAGSPHLQLAQVPAEQLRQWLREARSGMAVATQGEAADIQQYCRLLSRELKSRSPARSRKQARSPHKARGGTPRRMRVVSPMGGRRGLDDSAASSDTLWTRVKRA